MNFSFINRFSKKCLSSKALISKTNTPNSFNIPNVSNTSNTSNIFNTTNTSNTSNIFNTTNTSNIPNATNTSKTSNKLPTIKYFSIMFSKLSFFVFVFFLNLNHKLAVASQDFEFASQHLNFASQVNVKEKLSQKKNYWNEVDIKFNDLYGYINKQTCSSSTKAFYGCVVAVQTLANFSDKVYEIFPTEAVAQMNVVAKDGRLAIVELPKERMLSQKFTVKSLEKSHADFKYRFFLTSSNFIKAPDVEFEKLIFHAKNLLNKEISNDQIGLVILKYLETAVDPHTSLFPRAEFMDLTNKLDKSFNSIGVDLSKLNGEVLIELIFENSGAQKAGLLAGDFIIKIENKLTTGMSIDEINTELSGAEGSKVSLEILRNTKKWKVVVTRTKIENKVVQEKLIQVQDKKIAYIKLENFIYKNACEEIKGLITNFEAQQVAGYTLDLRSNGGGDIKIAQCLGGLFIGINKVIFYIETMESKKLVYKPLLTTADKITDKPLVILVNSGSASASEIISGGLQDYGRALIVGQKTFGKGSYQQCGQVGRKGELLLCQTGGLFFLPSGRTNQSLGVVPEVESYYALKANDAELEPGRESNLYLFPLASRMMPGSEFSSWPGIKVPKSCLAGQALEQKYQKSKGKDYYGKDFQLLNAVTSVICLSK